MKIPINVHFATLKNNNLIEFQLRLRHNDNFNAFPIHLC